MREELALIEAKLSFLRTRIETESEGAHSRLQAEYDTKIRDVNLEREAEEEKIELQLKKKKRRIKDHTDNELRGIKDDLENQAGLLRSEIERFYEQFTADPETLEEFEKPSSLDKEIGPFIRLGHFSNKLGLNLPVIIPLDSHFEFQTPEDTETLDMMNLVLLRACIAVQGELQIWPIDLKFHGGSFQFLDIQKYALFKETVTNETQLQAQLEHVLQGIHEIRAKYLTRDKPDFLSYNKTVSGQQIPYKILAIANFPYGFGTKSFKTLVDIMQSGLAAGVHVYLHTSDDAQFMVDWDLQAMTRKVPVYTLRQTQNQNYHWSNGYFPNLEIILDQIPDGFTTDKILHSGSKAEEGRRSNEPLPFEEILVTKADWGKATTEDSLSVVVGRSENNTDFEVELGSELKKIYHGVIFGGSGSGKGVLTRVLLTQLIAKYSPNELHLYLMDFKQGLDYAAYENHPIPHLKQIVTSNTPDFAIAVLRNLAREVVIRKAKIGTMDGKANSIGSYRELSGELMPRILLVVEELWALFKNVKADSTKSTELASLFNTLAYQGRAYGINLLLSSQDQVDVSSIRGTEGGIKPVYSEASLKILLPLGAVKQIREVMGLEDEDIEVAKNLKKGFALVNSAGNKSKIRIALLEQADQVPLLHNISEFYSKQKFKVNAKFYNVDKRMPLSSNQSFKRYFLEEHKDSSFRVWLGESLGSLEELTIEFRNTYGSNLVLVGGYREDANFVLDTILASIASANLHSNMSIKTYGIVPDPNQKDFVYSDFDLSASQDIGSVLAKLKAKIHEPSSNEKLLLLLYDLRAIESLLLTKSKSFSSYTLTDIGTDLLFVLEQGPSKGINVVLWSPNHKGYDKLIRCFDKNDIFEHKVWLRGASENRITETPSRYLTNLEQEGFGFYSSYGISEQNAVLFWAYQRIKNVDEIKNLYLNEQGD